MRALLRLQLAALAWFPFSVLAQSSQPPPEARALSQLATTSAAEQTNPSNWAIEVGLGAGSVRASDYSRRLASFDYSLNKEQRFRFSLGVERQLGRFVSVVARADRLTRQRFVRPAFPARDSFALRLWAVGAHARFSLPTRDGRFRAYLQVGGGPTIAGTKLRVREGEGAPLESFVERDVGYHLMALLGVELRLGRIVGIFAQGGYVFARGVRNLAGDEHDASGGVWLAGLRFQVPRTQ